MKKWIERGVLLVFVVLFLAAAGSLFLDGGWMHEFRQIPLFDARYAACWEAAETAGVGELGYTRVAEVDGELGWTAAVMGPGNSPEEMVEIVCEYDGTVAKVEFSSAH